MEFSRFLESAIRTLRGVTYVLALRLNHRSHANSEYRIRPRHMLSTVTHASNLFAGSNTAIEASWAMQLSWDQNRHLGILIRCGWEGSRGGK